MFFTCIQQLLDQCGSCSLLANPKINPAIRPIPKKIYDNMGRPITNVFDLEYDQEIWLSFGEPWKNPFSKFKWNPQTLDPSARIQRWNDCHFLS